MFLFILNEMVLISTSTYIYITSLFSGRDLKENNEIDNDTIFKIHNRKWRLNATRQTSIR